jgi:hypothetical protein
MDDEDGFFRARFSFHEVHSFLLFIDTDELRRSLCSILEIFFKQNIQTYQVTINCSRIYVFDNVA